MLLASFGDKMQSAYGHVVASLQSVQESLTWETVTARLLQEYEERVSRVASENLPKTQEPGTDLAANRGRASGSGKKQKGFRRGSEPETRRCFRCNQVGHIAKDCKSRRKWKTRRSEEDVQYSDHEDGNAYSAELLLSVADHGCDVSTSTGEATERVYDVRVQEANEKRCSTCFSEVHSYARCSKSTLNCEMADREHGYATDEDHFAAVASWETTSGASVIEFILDSGASDHMVRNINWLHDLQQIDPRAIVHGNGTKIFAIHRGTLLLRTLIGHGNETYEREIELKNVLFVPDLRSNLISCSMLCNDEDYTVNFYSSKCVGLQDGVIQFQGRKVNGVFRIKCFPISPSMAFAHLARHSDQSDDSAESIDIWHTRLGHAHPERIRRLLRTGAVTGLGLKSGPESKDPCSACMRGKQTREVLRPNKSRPKKKCAVIHADVCGPMSVSSFSGARYFVCFVDEHSGHKTVVPIARKSDVKKNFIWYQAWLERNTT